MKKLLILVAICLMIGVASAEELSANAVRDFTLPDINEKPISLSQYLGEKIIIIDFWASWCVPCLSLMPEMEKIHKENDDVVVLAVSIDNPRGVRKAKSHLRSQKYSMISLFDTNQEISKRFNVTNIPHSFVIGLDGEIIYEHKGYTKGDEENILKKLQEYRAEHKK